MDGSAMPCQASLSKVLIEHEGNSVLLFVEEAEEFYQKPDKLFIY